MAVLEGRRTNVPELDRKMRGKLQYINGEGKDDTRIGGLDRSGDGWMTDSVNFDRIQKCQN